MTEEWDAYTRFLGLFVASGYVKNAKPLSLLLVGEPGVGKSQLLERFNRVPIVVQVMDLTSDGMKHKLFPAMVRDGKRIILYPDFAKMFQRNLSTAENALGLITQAMSGELHEMYVGNTEMIRFKGFCIGLLAAMPTQVYYNWRRTAVSTGIQDRFAVVPVSFSPEQKASIERSVAADDPTMTTHVPWTWPTGQLHVDFDKKLAPKILQLADEVQPAGERNRLIGRLKVMHLAAAILNGNDHVGKWELEQVRDFLPLLKAMR